MLNDHDLKALRKIGRRLRAESPKLIRLVHSLEPRPATSRRKWARARMLVFAVAFTWLALAGPRVLNDAEIRARKTPPLPRRSPPYDTTTRHTGPAPDPDAQAAEVMAEHPAALQLRLLQTVVEVAAEKNSTLVLAFPVELLRFLEKATQQGSEWPDMASAAASSDPGRAPDGQTAGLAPPQIPDDARGLELNTHIAGRHSG